MSHSNQGTVLKYGGTWECKIPQWPSTSSIHEGCPFLLSPACFPSSLTSHWASRKIKLGRVEEETENHLTFHGWGRCWQGDGEPDHNTQSRVSISLKRTTRSFRAHLSTVCQQWHNHWTTSGPALSIYTAATNYKIKLRMFIISQVVAPFQLTCKREAAYLLLLKFGTSMESCF